MVLQMAWSMRVHLHAVYWKPALASLAKCPCPRPAPPGGLAPPLFLHVPPAASGSGDRRLSESTFEREWEQRVAAVFRSQVGVVERYSDPGGLWGVQRC